MDNLWIYLDKGKSVLLLLLDLSVVCNTVEHSISISCLASLGICGNTLAWFASFQGYSQKVAIWDEQWIRQLLGCGVPQGSILSLMLFNTYNCPLAKLIRFGVGCHQYPDATQIFLLVD